ncbi:uncharacterized protein LOC143882721 [Tasmannia lanceolata]|uniref:uncharacterized protein LOC143882721 n=1 Tax=Tasmannia lanceolata TaxID=3420 RepID=UPI004064934B
MGNYISCTLSSTTGRHSRGGTKVIFPSGEIRQFDQPINAAELMLEIPHHFLVNSSSLQIGRRFSALSADEDLEMGNVYVMFPMRRVNSVITAADMGALFMIGNSAVRRASRGKARILPESGVSAQSEPEKLWLEKDAPRLRLDEIEDDSVSEFKARLSMYRSRKPKLETIAEETVSSR